MKKLKAAVPITTTVGDAVNTAFSVVEELAEEMRSSFDNTPESLQGGGVGEARGEAADALESISEPTVPEVFSKIEVSFGLIPLKKRASRADRLSDGLEYARQAIEALEEFKTSRENAAGPEDSVESPEFLDGHRVYRVDEDHELGPRIVALYEDELPNYVKVLDDRGGSGSWLLLVPVADSDTGSSDEDTTDEAVDAVIEEIQAMIDEAEDVTFPGMYG